MKVRCPQCQAVLVVPAAARPEEGIRGEPLQVKGGRLPDSPKTDFDLNEPPRPRRRESESFPVGWIVGGVAGVAALVVVITVLVLVFLREPEPPPQPQGQFVEMKGPGMNIKIELPKDFPNIQLPDNFPQAPVPFQPEPFQPPPGKPAPRPAPFQPQPAAPVGNPPPKEPEDPDPVNRALKKLRSENLSEQNQGVRLLLVLEPAAKRRAEVLPILKKIASSPRAFPPRGDAVKAIAHWGTKDDAPFLLTLLDDNENAVREAAIVTLGQWKDARAADPVAQRLVNGHDRPWASQALKELGSAAEKPVTELLRHANADVRLEACRVLRVIATKESHAALVDAAEDGDERVMQAAREALPPALRPPIYGPKQFIKLNVHVKNPQAWPEIEGKLKKLVDAPKAVIKVSTSGEYKWVDLAPVNGTAEAFAQKIRFAKITAVHNDSRLIYIDSGK
jgi:hypothetical protein